MGGVQVEIMKKTEQKYREKQDENIVKEAWVNEKVGNIGTISQNWDSFFGTIWSTVDQKNVRKRPISPTHCFYISPWDLPTFSGRAKNASFGPRSYSKGPDHAFQHVLTTETPCM